MRWQQYMNSSKIKKILIAYHRFPPIADDLQNAFRRLGVDARIFYTTDYEHWFYRRIIRNCNRHARNLRLISKGGDLFESHPLNLRNYVSSKFAEVFQQYSPDAVLVIHGLPFGGAVLSTIKVPKIAWHIEPRDDLPYLVDNASPFDIYNSYSQHDVDLLTEAGVDCRYMSHAADSARFYSEPGVEQNLDVAFVGNWSGWRDEVLQATLEVTENVALYGGYWKKKSSIPRAQLKRILKGEFIVGQELNHLYNTSKIVLNASRTKGSFGLNMRFFEVLAAGGVLLSDEVPELEKQFVPTEHMLRYQSPGELKKILKQILSSADEREKIRLAGQSLVLNSYSYDKMAERILIQCGEVLETRPF